MELIFEIYIYIYIYIKYSDAIKHYLILLFNFSLLIPF